jgi:Tol biopolymer transport system component
MTELREVFEMVTKQTEPDRDSWRQQEERQRRAATNRKWGAIAVAAAITAALVVFVLNDSGTRHEQPAGDTSAPAVAPEPPLGAMIVGLDGKVRQTIPGLPYNTLGAPELSPDGRFIAFMSGDRVAVMGRDGTGMQVLTGSTAVADGDAHQSLSWSPDGTRIAYVDDNDIWVTNADGTGQRRLTNDPSGDFQPAWSSRDVIAYWHGPMTGEDGGPSDSEIYTIPASGGTPTRLTDDGASSIEPAWSPDGSRIAYFHGLDLWVMRADGTRNHLLDHVSGGAWSPAWSPDGLRIAFLSCCADHRSVTDDRPLLDVRVLDLASGDVRRLDMNVETDYNGPSWAGNDALLINRYD